MAKCSFCSKQVEPGRGLIYVAPDKVHNYCSSKCMKNFRLGRDKRKVAWIKKSHSGKLELKQELLEEAKETQEKTGNQESPEKKEQPAKAENKDAEKKQEKK